MKKENTPTQVQLLRISSVFLASRYGEILDAVRAARSLHTCWGIDVDWHMISFALDRLETHDLATRTGRCFDGHVEYKIHSQTRHDPPPPPAPLQQNHA